MDGKTLREAIGPCFALLLRGYDYAGAPDEKVLTAIVDKLVPMFEDHEAKRVEAIQAGLALAIERGEESADARTWRIAYNEQTKRLNSAIASADYYKRQRDESDARLIKAEAERVSLRDQLAEARADARAEVATLTLKLANARLNLKHCSEEVDKRDDLDGQLAEARAKLEIYAGNAADHEVRIAALKAEVESCRKAYAQMRSTEDEWKRDTLAAHKAEVERLKKALVEAGDERRG